MVFLAAGSKSDRRSGAVQDDRAQDPGSLHQASIESGPPWIVEPWVQKSLRPRSRLALIERCS